MLVQGTHNVAGALDHSQYKQERYFDAHLTTLGWQQGAALKAHVASQDKPLTATLQLVVVSPLTRAVETAVAAFGGACPALPGEPLLMEAQSAVEGLRVERPSVSAVGVPPFLVCELCREHLGVHPCDRRRPLSYYRKAYPALDWSQVEEEEARAPPRVETAFHSPVRLQDVLWTADTRESDEALALRAGAFLRWLALRPEQHIAVVTHSSWLDILFRRFTGECSPVRARAARVASRG